MPAWLSIPLYMGSIGIIVWSGWLLKRVLHARRLQAKEAHDDLVLRAKVKERMYVVPREPSRRRAASP